MAPSLEQFFPGRAPIDAYGNGGFRFAEMSHRGSVLMLPSGIYGWEATDMSSATPTAFEPVFAERDDIGFVLFGTGLEFLLPDAALRAAFTERSLPLEPMDTGAAARTYNVLLAEGRNVAAALIAVDLPD